MRHVILSMALLLLVFGFGSCRMRYASGMPYKVYHITPRNHKHWGAPKYSNGPDRFWSRHRYGPRTYKYRGHYREYQHH
jgi:hypothetical protein